MKKILQTITQQPLSCSGVGNFFKLIYDNQFIISPKYFLRFLCTLIINIFANFLFFWEWLFFSRKIKNATITKDPIFIIGHWRSGTTFLHNIISQDKQLGYLTTAEATMPNLMFLFQPLVHFFFNLMLPLTRPMDKVVLSIDGPQEEELALGNISRYSAYHGWYFPKRFQHYFNKWGLMDGLSEADKIGFKNVYMRLVKKISLKKNNRQLVLKNPVNTARIPILLELFPNASFIYLHRETPELYLSTLRLHSKSMECVALQDFSQLKLKKHVQDIHKKLIQKYETDKMLIHPSKLIEISYTELIDEPLKSIQAIYEKIGIEDFEQAKGRFEKYIFTQNNFEPVVYGLNGVP